MSLMKDENRKAFKADEAGYIKQFHMSPDQEKAILTRDYNRMLELGGNIYFTAKLGATDGHSFQHLAAVMTGNTQQGYAEMMLGGRPQRGRQPLAFRQAQQAGNVDRSKVARRRRPQRQRRQEADAKSKSKSSAKKRK